VMGIVGSGVIAQWAYALVRDTNVILLDREPAASDLSAEIRNVIESDNETGICDLHIWQIGVNQFAAIISVVTHQPRPPQFYKDLLREHTELAHITVECRPETRLVGSRRPTAAAAAWIRLAKISCALIRPDGISAADEGLYSRWNQRFVRLFRSVDSR
jgi:hypothetical protein